MYTIKTLKKINLSYDYDHIITLFDVQKANRMVKIIENSRNDNMPIDGDRVIYTDEYGKTFEWALFAGKGTYADRFALCENSYTPFCGVSRRTGNFYTNASGGAWPSITDKELKRFKLVKKAKATFCDWGHCGATANGAIDFKAIVNVWRFKKNKTQ